MSLTLPVLTEAAAWLPGPVFLLIALAAVLVLEQALAGLLRATALRREPLVSDGHRLAGYRRSVWTWAAPEVRALWLGLLACAVCLCMVALHHLLWALPAAGLFVLALAWDIEHGTVVVASRWQVAWRCGWHGRIRRVPTAQIARVHRIETPPWRGQGRRERARRAWHRLVGTGQLALELHNGHAVRLPATDLLIGRRALRDLAALLKARQAEAVAHRLADRRDHREDTRPAGLTPPPDDAQALQREIARLRAVRSSRSRPGGSVGSAPRHGRPLRDDARVPHHLPPPDPSRLAPDTLIMG